MLIYATILIASLILAVVALVLYKVISGSSKAVNRSKGRIAATNAFNSQDRSGGVTRWNEGKTVPAVPQSSSGLDYQVPGQLARQGAGVGHSGSHDVSTAEPVDHHNKNTGWLGREDRRAPGGKVYKVKRTSARKPAGSQSMNEPWGW